MRTIINIITQPGAPIGRIGVWRGVLAAAVVAAVIAWAALSGAGRLTAAALVALGRRVDLVALFVLTYTIGFWLRSRAWRELMRSSVPTGQLFALHLIGLAANHLLPAKAGDAVRALLLVRRGMRAREAAWSIAAARGIDLVVLALLAAAGAAGGGIALAVGPAAGARRDRMSRRLGRALLWSVPGWALEAGAVWVAAAGSGVMLSPASALAVTAGTLLGQVFHLAPGGLGTYEAVMTFLLARAGVAPQRGLAIAMLTHGLKFAYAFAAGGAAWAWWMGRRGDERRIRD